MKKFIIANWKCNPSTEKKAKQLFLSVKKGLKKKKNFFFFFFFFLIYLFLN